MNQWRKIHTTIWASGQVAKLSRDARLLYIGLISLGDDDGRLKGSPALLRSQLFPYDDDVKVADVAKWLKEIEGLGLIVGYCIENECFFFHPKWESYQSIREDRRKNSNIPAPTLDFPPLTTKRQPTGNQVGAKPPLRLDKNREDKIRLDTVGSDAAFVAFWDKYPRKTAKKAAWKAWQKIQYTDELGAKIMRALESACRSEQWKKDAGRYIPHPATWLNGERWEDELTPARPSNSKYDNVGTTVRS